jgi:hypothetical protein
MREDIKLQQQKVNAILQVAPPCNVKQVRSFIGMLNHYKAMIPHCSQLLTPLTALTKKNVKFEWTTKHQQAFDSLKNSLSREVVLAYPDFSIPFKIYTDTSKYQIRSIITQKDKPLALKDKESITVACTLDQVWLCCYPHLVDCLHDKGTEFVSAEFQELLQLYGI